LTLTEPSYERLVALIAHYDLDIDIFDADWPHVWRGVEPVIQAGISYGRAGMIDFTDMVYLLTALDLPCPHYDYLFVDEAQDLNAAQLALVMRCCTRGRLLFVGDARQSIYAFGGADTHSIDTIIERTQATVLPLSICYRCPSRVVSLAAQVFPGIEPAPQAELGTIEILKAGQLSSAVRPGDLVLCRTTAPLVEQCLALLRAGIRATVRGKDLGKSFLNLLAKLRKRKGFVFEALSQLCEGYRREQEMILSSVADNEMKLATMHDQVDTFQALLEAYLNQAQGDGTLGGFEVYIQSFFTDDANGHKPVMFSTVHKAKGLEYDRVFILRPDLFPHPAAKKEWQLEQEYHLEYVALTRAKQALYFVGSLINNLTLEDEVPRPSKQKGGEEERVPVQLSLSPQTLAALHHMHLSEEQLGPLVETLLTSYPPFVQAMPPEKERGSHV
jgi:DNA helicase-2/ATP-dependent DNA helicase PcrA